MSATDEYLRQRLENGECILASVDKRGRIYIPRILREMCGISAPGYVAGGIKNGVFIIGPMKLEMGTIENRV